ncbi:T6SS phospholipase effector Tle1-like catalytic domain-containing protein [Flavobacterium sp. GCM10023249]|uniref:T6SS phospholipase effector Tle1-like catalytic domain-containing protein n=1 Tax=unclassified Flavobacterium TaxID=196869 RepID=UPI00360A6367
MGITRIVEGDLINTSTEMNLTANAGNYEFSTPMKNQWKGEADGVVESDYKASNKEDTLSNSINVNLNLFFDGTQNNKTNTEARNPSSGNHQAYIKTGNKNDDSFENDYTNVARGYDAVDSNVENQVKVYIEGIGTENLKSDSKFPGVATGMGDTGVTAKVTKGCMDAAKQMFEKGYNNKEIDILFVNVYGFSRGAAAARHFLHVASKMANYSLEDEISDKKNKYKVYPDYLFNDKIHQFNLVLENTKILDNYGYFGACLLHLGMKIKKIIFNFVGIYDTVASLGAYHGNDVKELKLDSIQKAKYVFHLVSDDEYRENFDLSDINSAGLSGLELTLPGVHSDIGGSYLDNVEEISVIDNIQIAETEDHKNMAKERKDKEYDLFKKYVVEEGWFKDPQIKKQFFYEKDLDRHTKWYENQYNYGLVGRRVLFNSYDKIPLDLMIEKSKDFNVKYKPDKLEDYKIKDSFINIVYNQIKDYYNAKINIRNRYVVGYNKELKNFDLYSKNYFNEVKSIHYINYMDNNDLHRLRNEYLHWSVKSNLFGLSARNEGALKQEVRKREIHHG